MSNITDDDLNKIVQGMKGHTMTSGERMADNVTKIVVGLCSIGIVWIVNGISDIKTQQARTDEWRSISVQQMQVFSKFMEKPRFTSDDFDAKAQPILYAIQENRSELDRRMATVQQVKENTKDITLLTGRIEAMVSENEQ